MPTAAIDLLLDYEVLYAAHFLFHIEAASHDAQRTLEECLSIRPSMPVRTFSDERSGNRFVRLDAPKGLLSVNYHARVEVNTRPHLVHLNDCPVSAIPDGVLRFLMPSRYCESDVLRRAALQLFGDFPHGLSRVRAIENWLHESIEYMPGSGKSTTTAQEVFVQRAGVCRDFAHLGITLCRALNIPARLVVGYVHFAEPPQDFHTVFEAWLDHQWVLFDGTKKASVDRLVRVGTGLDAKDVAFATIFGRVRLIRQELVVDEGALVPLRAVASGASGAARTLLLVPS